MKNSVVRIHLFALGIVIFLSGAAAAQTNTNYGSGALSNVTTGKNNSAFGFNALNANRMASSNTAVGSGALEMHAGVSGTYSADGNTAVGFHALNLSTTANNNTAIGALALENNTTGFNNTALGVFALVNNTTGYYSTAIGLGALNNNTTGSNNVALGFAALASNISGGQNLAVGYEALYSNTTGVFNSAYGLQALYYNTTGKSNLAVGYQSGLHVTGSNNIEIVNTGSSTDNGTIRIGTQGTHTQTFIAGITGSAVTGSDVVVNSSGKLGVVVSSARYKRDIKDMGASSEALMKLRPVSFTYKSDEQKTKQYGLVAEEVEQVYPELVMHDQDGNAQSVRYSMLTSMLINELQKQKKELTEVRLQLKASHERESSMQTSFDERLSKLEQTVAAKEGNRNLAAAFSR